MRVCCGGGPVGRLLGAFLCPRCGLHARHFRRDLLCRERLGAQRHSPTQMPIAVLADNAAARGLGVLKCGGRSQQS